MVFVMSGDGCLKTPDSAHGHIAEKILSLLQGLMCFIDLVIILTSFSPVKIIPIGFSDHNLVNCGCFIKSVKVKSAY